MLQNPGYNHAFYLYNPYSKKLTREEYAHEQMEAIRRKEIQRAAHAQEVGVIIGTLGRQGDLQLYRRIRSAICKSGRRALTLLLS